MEQAALSVGMDRIRAGALPFGGLRRAKGLGRDHISGAARGTGAENRRGYDHRRRRESQGGVPGCGYLALQ